MADAARDGNTILGIKAAVTGTTLLIAGGMASTSLQFIPGLITAAQRAPERPQVNRLESGRLTPQPQETKGLTIARNAPSSTASEGYRLPAQQFLAMSRTAFALQVPPELLSIAASGYLAYHSYQHSTMGAGHKWTAVAVLIAAVFPLTGGFMVPLNKKLAQIAGEEEKPEPYEDAPLDRDAERKNTVLFLRQWNSLNTLRSSIMFVAGGLGLWGLVD